MLVTGSAPPVWEQEACLPQRPSLLGQLWREGHQGGGHCCCLEIAQERSCYGLPALPNRVGRFQVCVSDFFHLLNLGVCYREKNEKNFQKKFGTPLTLAPSHTWRVNKFTSKFFCIPALKFQIPFWQLVPGFRPPLLSRTTDWNRNITHIQWLKHETTNSL